MNNKVVLKPRKERDCSFSIRVDKDVYGSYEELSSITGYSRNELINLAMKHYLDIVEIDTKDEMVLQLINEFKIKQSKQ